MCSSAAPTTPLLSSVFITGAMDTKVERETYSPYLQSNIWSSAVDPGANSQNSTQNPDYTKSPPPAQRLEEGWSVKTEALLLAWSTQWDAKSTAHSDAEANKRWKHQCLQLPTVIIPIVLAPLLASQYLSETSPAVVILLVVSGLAGALQSTLQMERKSEQHAQAAFRYADLLTDAEEIMSKDRFFRPTMDVTIQKFKMRMDSAERYSPPVHVKMSGGAPGARAFIADDNQSDEGVESEV